MKQRSTRRALRATTRAVLWLAGLATRRASVDAKWTRHFRVLLALRERLLRESVELLEKGAQALEPCDMDIADPALDEFDLRLRLGDRSAVEITGKAAGFTTGMALSETIHSPFAHPKVAGAPLANVR